MIQQALWDVVEKAVRTNLDRFSVSRVEIGEGKDSGNDDALFVTVHLPAQADSIPGDAMLATMGAVSDAVLELGDERFPYVRTFRDGEDDVVAESSERR